MLKNKIKDLRTAKNMTQEELAKILGLSTSIVGMYETGARKPSYEALVKIANYFKVSTDYLLSVKEKLEIAMDSLAKINKMAIEGLESTQKPSLIKKFENNVDLSSLRSVRETRTIPMVGTVAAGTPILAEENIEGYMQIDTFFLNKDKNYYLLKIKGDSMNTEFQEGTWVLIEKTPYFESGQLGVILIDGGEATIKKVILNDNVITLIPMSTNVAHQPIMYNIEKDNVQIIGRVIMALKKY